MFTTNWLVIFCDVLMRRMSQYIVNLTRAIIIKDNMVAVEVIAFGTAINQIYTLALLIPWESQLEKINQTLLCN